ncbi:MAG: glycosyltransferase [Anaerolineae bacterium]|nr:glycosyltransferase [Anaerolineae bacterium]
MHILVLTPTLPYPLHQGGAIRNYGILHGLHAAGHEITLLSFEDQRTNISETPLAHLCAQVYTVPVPTRTARHRIRDLFLSPQPDLVRRLRSKQFIQMLCSVLESQSFNLVQFEGLEMTRYIPIVRQYQPLARLCYDAHNAEYALQEVIAQVDQQSARRWLAAVYSRIQARRIKRFEHYICQQVDLVVAVSDEDAQALKDFRPDNAVTVVPNGIFVQDYAQSTEALDLGEKALVFTGKMDYRPNVDAMLWFTEDILPCVQVQQSQTVLYIVGQKPHARLEALRSHPAIVVTGRVEDVKPYLYSAAVYVAPLRMGSGTRLKILEAMAAGCAVVATDLAAAGLPSEVRQNLITADTPEDISASIIRLLENPQERLLMGKQAQLSVQQHYDWSALLPHLLTAYKEIELG